MPGTYGAGAIAGWGAVMGAEVVEGWVVDHLKHLKTVLVWMMSIWLGGIDRRGRCGAMAEIKQNRIPGLSGLDMTAPFVVEFLHARGCDRRGAAGP
ncbi:hypothetical protein, partial [Actinomyces slackii]